MSEREIEALAQEDIHEIVQAIVRGMLGATENGLEARAGELFFRPQRVALESGAVMLADEQTVQRHAQESGLGNVGRLLRELKAPLKPVELAVIDEQNCGGHFDRDERYDAVLSISPRLAGSRALCLLIARWIALHGIDAVVSAVREIPDQEWLWHVGLDTEATLLLNAVYNGEELEEEPMKRVIGLFRADFADPTTLRPELRGVPVLLGLAMTRAGTLRMKPQNLLMNLPLARRT